MTAALQDNELTVFHIVYYAVEGVNPARPPAGQILFQRFGLADSTSSILQRSSA
jgi:hypothetical protein